MSCLTIFFIKKVQISRSDIRPHIKWAVSLVVLHMVTSIFLQGCVREDNIEGRDDAGVG